MYAILLLLGVKTMILVIKLTEYSEKWAGYFECGLHFRLDGYGTVFTGVFGVGSDVRLGFQALDPEGELRQGHRHRAHGRLEKHRIQVAKIFHSNIWPQGYGSTDLRLDTSTEKTKFN